MRELQRQIIVELGVKPEINPQEEIESRIHFLATELGKSGLNGFVLGISGGQDSLLAGMLAQQAVERQRSLGQNAKFLALLLPYGEQADREDALLAIETIQPDEYRDLDIKTATDGMVQAFEVAEGRPPSDYNKGNLKARDRMEAQYLYSGERGGRLVIGTDHAAEAVVGFFTKYGDGGADILPLSGLTKRQGKALLRELGAPAQFITKAPTADLLDAIPRQADETELGVTYDALDDYLEGRSIDDTDAETIEAYYLKTMHKRKQPIAYTD